MWVVVRVYLVMDCENFELIDYMRMLVAFLVIVPAYVLGFFSEKTILVIAEMCGFSMLGVFLMRRMVVLQGRRWNPGLPSAKVSQTALRLKRHS